ncbi:MAG TPA: phage holin family protein [Albitalea sp.]|uniref:phage holin family protein n=1 Tax=Piscinibacter sp. TaxID=1903157 RepID=UPI002ED3BFF9
MIHPLFRLIVSEPQMLAEHVEAYAELMSEEAGAVAKRLKRKVVLHAVSGFFGFLAVILACVGLMLWAALPIEDMRAPWALLLIPAIAVLGAVAAHIAAKSRAEEGRGMQAVREQMAADAAMLRSVTES